jgi:hypothetical protein
MREIELILSGGALFYTFMLLWVRMGTGKWLPLQIFFVTAMVIGITVGIGQWLTWAIGI